MNYAKEQRLRFIDFLLATYGYIGRNEVMAFFGISAAQATRDFRDYKEIAPNNCLYNVTLKRYEKSGNFKLIWGL